MTNKLKERFIVEITADNRESFRTLKHAHVRSTELMFAGIPHTLIHELTETREFILSEIGDEQITRADELRARAVVTLTTIGE